MATEMMTSLLSAGHDLGASSSMGNGVTCNADGPVSHHHFDRTSKEHFGETGRRSFAPETLSPVVQDSQGSRQLNKGDFSHRDLHSASTSGIPGESSRPWSRQSYTPAKGTPRVFPGAWSPPTSALSPEPLYMRSKGRAESLGCEDSVEESREQILSVSFNQDNSCFACGTTGGFRVFSCSSSPVKEFLCRASPCGPPTCPSDDPNSGDSLPRQRQQLQLTFSGGVQRVEMLYRSNFMALVGGGPRPRFPPNKVVVWDDDQGRCVGELVFRSEIRGVRLRRDRVVVLLEHKVYIYSLVDLRLLGHVDTMPASHGLWVAPTTVAAASCGPDAHCATGAAGSGLFAISQAPHGFVLACLGLQKGQVRIEHFDVQRTRMIMAHESCIAALALTADGARLATASVRGTLARIFSTTDGTMLQELRRGADRAEIYSLAFSPQGAFLALTSDKGTAHVFAVTASAAGTTPAVLCPSSSVVIRGSGPRGLHDSADSGALSCTLQASRVGADSVGAGHQHGPMQMAQSDSSRSAGLSSSEAVSGGCGQSRILAQSEGMLPPATLYQRRLPSPLHRPQAQHWSQHQWQRLRQSQSCPPRRLVAERASGGTVQIPSKSAPSASLSPSFLLPEGEAQCGEGHQECDSGHLEESAHACNPGSSLAFMRGVLPRYFSSEWSVAQFRHLPTTSRSVVAFGAQKNTLLVVTNSGRFFRLRFDPLHGGEMVLEESSDVFQLDCASSEKGSSELAASCKREAFKNLLNQLEQSI